MDDKKFSWWQIDVLRLFAFDFQLLCSSLYTRQRWSKFICLDSKSYLIEHMTDQTIIKMNLRRCLLIISIMIMIRIPIGNAISRKRKMCVQYQIRNSRWTEIILRIFYGISEGRCLWQCTRHPQCMAYNMRHADGTCELLPDIGTCAETNETEGSTFVSLGDCNGKVPWDVGRRNWTSDGPCLTWHIYYAYNYQGPCPSGTLRGPGGWSCVSLVPNKGLYLPGWSANRRNYRVVNEEQQITSYCDGVGYILKVAPGCSTAWQPYIVGGPLPPKVVNISTWKDGTPLYFVAGLRLNNGDWYLGYLMHSVQRTFIPHNNMENPTNVTILVFTWMRRQRQTEGWVVSRSGGRADRDGWMDRWTKTTGGRKMIDRDRFWQTDMLRNSVSDYLSMIVIIACLHKCLC